MDLSATPTFLIELHAGPFRPVFHGLLEKEGQEYRLAFRRQGRKQQPQKPLRFRFLDLQRAASYAKSLPEARDLLKRRLDFVSLDVRARIGLEDAAWTALCAGSIQALLYALLNILLPSRRVHVSVRPDFEKPGFLFGAECIIHCYVGDLMLITTQTLSAMARAAFRSAGAVRTAGRQANGEG